jgi:diaminopimelate decarboxylase
MATATRIYRVLHKASKTVRLVRAVHQASALRHVSSDAYDCGVASQEEIVAAMEAGIKPEDVKAGEPGDGGEPTAT